jgi:hypothetical protein
LEISCPASFPPAFVSGGAFVSAGGGGAFSATAMEAPASAAMMVKLRSSFIRVLSLLELDRTMPRVIQVKSLFF